MNGAEEENRNKQKQKLWADSMEFTALENDKPKKKKTEEANADYSFPAPR